MCGFVGLVGIDGTARADREFGIDAGLAALVHRGPDACRRATLVSPNGVPVVLGAVRLRIIDLRAEGDMPMASEDGALHLVYNGELYNSVELRRQLERSGHVFRTRTDTECILHLYEESGGAIEKVVDKLRGMFAFAIWDANRQRLVAARDRLGIKPLVYASTRNGFLFGSETRALAKTGLLDHHTLDPASANHYLLWGAFPATRTPLIGVERLPPGHHLVYEGGQAVVAQYWSPAPRPLAMLGDAATAAHALGSAIDDAVARHLIADRPVGLFLSSGVDSSVLAAVAARHGAVSAMTLSFPGDELDEGPASASIAQHYGHAHSRLVLTDAEVASSLMPFVASLDSPTVDAFNTWLVCREAAAAGLIVALTGLGGDELVGGYSTFASVPVVRRLLRARAVLPYSVRRLLTQSMTRYPGGRARRFFDARDADVTSAYDVVRGLFAPSDLGLAHGLGRPAAFDRALPVGDQVSLLELSHYLGGQLLADTDTVSMAHSLEIRVPFLDDRVVDTALAIPAATRLRPGKVTLLEAAGITTPIKKRPFHLPMSRWLHGTMHQQLRAALLDDHLPYADLLPAHFRRKLWMAFEERHCHWSRPWAVAVLRLWPVANGITE